MITQHIKGLVSRKFSGLLRIICQVWGKNKICKIFQNRERQSNAYGSLGKSHKNDFKITISFKAPTNLP